MKKTVGVFARRYDEHAERPFGIQTSFFESLSQDGQDLGIDFVFFSVDTWQENETTIDTLRFDGHQWHSDKVLVPTIIFDRFFSSKQARAAAKAFRRFARANDVQFTTPIGLASLTGNKSKFNHFLKKHNLPRLKSFAFERITETRLQKLLDKHGTVYLKPYSGLGGQGIVIVEKLKKEQLKWYQRSPRFLLHSLATETVTLKAKQLLPALNEYQDFSRYMVQPDANAYGFEDSPVCIRVLVQNQGGQNYSVTGTIARVGAKKARLAVPGPEERALPLHELADYYQSVYQKDIFVETAQIDEICLLCCDKLHEKFGGFLEIGFDVMLTKDQGPIILEANSKPGRVIFGKLADRYPAGSTEEAQYRVIQRNCIQSPSLFINSLFS